MTSPSSFRSCFFTRSVRQWIQDTQTPKTVQVKSAVVSQYTHSGAALKLSRANNCYKIPSVINLSPPKNLR